MERSDEQLSTRDLAGADRDEPAEHDPSTPPDEAVARGAEEHDAAEREAPASTAELSDNGAGGADALLPHDEDARFQERWQEIQTGFVDEPRQTVEQADELVAQVMKRLAEGFAAERERLEQQWGRGEDISTEDLRVALQRYRAFFQRLLSA
jgi:hypothetical protein